MRMVHRPLVRMAVVHSVLTGLSLLAGPCALLVAGEAPPVAAPPGGASQLVAPAVVELHGRLRGEPFWARLQAADPKYGNKRVLQLVYTPPSAETLAGAHLSDCPFVLLDDQLGVAAWNDRDSSASAQARAAGYAVSRDLLVGDGDAKHSEAVARPLPGAAAWDLHLAPVLLALCWQEGRAGQARVVDLYGPRFQEAMSVAWHAQEVTLAGQALMAKADGTGHLASLVAADGTVLLAVTGRP